jgi:hypothetical protein
MVFKNAMGPKKSRHMTFQVVPPKDGFAHNTMHVEPFGHLGVDKHIMLHVFIAILQHNFHMRFHITNLGFKMIHHYFKPYNTYTN